MPQIKSPPASLLRTINLLHSKQKGKIAAIEPISKKYFIGEDIIDAYERGQRNFRIDFSTLYE